MVDIGTGPFALLAIAAARLGAEKVRPRCAPGLSFLGCGQLSVRSRSREPCYQQLLVSEKLVSILSGVVRGSVRNSGFRISRVGSAAGVRH